MNTAGLLAISRFLKRSMIEVVSKEENGEREC